VDGRLLPRLIRTADDRDILSLHHGDGDRRRVVTAASASGPSAAPTWPVSQSRSATHSGQTRS